MKIRSKNILATLMFLLAMVVFQACGNAPIFEENKEIPNYNWDYKSPVSFEVNITDTTKYCNMYINLRINGDYKYSNIFMWVSKTMPDKSIERERVEFTLANDRGKWEGDGLGDIYTYQLQYKPRVKFKQSGIYTFTLEQNMRDEILANVLNAGIRVEFWNEKSKAW